MSLRDKAYSASRWTAFSGLGRTVLQIVQTAILARLLHPSDFGLMALVGAMLAIATLFADLGISRAIVHFENMSASAQSSLYWFNVGTGMVLSLVFAVTAPWVATLYAQPALAGALLAASPVFLLTSLGQQFSIIAEKELRFSALALNEILATFLGLIVAVLVGLRGGGVYALVCGALATAGATSLLAWIRLSAGHRPSGRWNVAEAMPFLRYGGYLTAENLANTLLRQADVFVGGIIAAPVTLGTYSVPRDLCMKLSLVINPIITRVGFPVMARLQHDHKALAEVYRQTLLMTTSVNVPSYGALYLFADDIIALLYGSQWGAAAPFLRVLAAWGLIRSISNPLGSLLYATGHARRALWWSLGLLLVVPPLLLVGGHVAGLPGLAWSLVIIYGVLFIPSWYFLIRPTCGLAFGPVMNALIRPLAAAAVAWIAVMLLRWDTSLLWLRLAAGLVEFGGFYVAASLIVNPTWVRTVLQLLLLRRA